MKVLFLYTELAGYFIKCCEALSKTADVHIVRWPVNSEAPFNFTYPAEIKIYSKNEYSKAELRELVARINPDMIVCSGWIDKDYLTVVKDYHGKIPTVLALDTHWKGSPKQYAAALLARIYLLNRFSHAWVPGKAQERYALKLGFKSGNIHKGFYCCDLEAFNQVYTVSANQGTTFPKLFIYSGRYYAFKGLTDLWEAFSQLKAESHNDWELLCMGNGDLTPLDHPAIKHLGFVQPADLHKILVRGGVSILPSRYEPWAVAVQEFAAAGYPLVLSNAVGAAEAFLEEGGNGFSFRAANIAALKECLKKITELSDKELFLMTEKSHELAQRITPAQWVDTVSGIYNGFHKK